MDKSSKLDFQIWLAKSLQITLNSVCRLFDFILGKGTEICFCVVWKQWSWRIQICSKFEFSKLSCRWPLVVFTNKLCVLFPVDVLFANFIPFSMRKDLCFILPKTTGGLFYEKHPVPRKPRDIGTLFVWKRFLEARLPILLCDNRLVFF